MNSKWNAFDAPFFSAEITVCSESQNLPKPPVRASVECVRVIFFVHGKAYRQPGLCAIAVHQEPILVATGSRYQFISLPAFDPLPSVAHLQIRVCQ